MYGYGAKSQIIKKKVLSNEIRFCHYVTTFINLLYYSVLLKVSWNLLQAIAASHLAVADFTVVYTKWSSDRIGMYNDFRFVHILFLYFYISKYCSYELSIHQS